MPNNSPWLHQLNRTRPLALLKGRHAADLMIVGGGIAGIATAYFILRHTEHKVVLVEADKVAHGATGHNGGFLASYFERTFSSLVQEYGLKLATAAQREIETSWDLLDEIRREAKLKTPMWQFTGYAACATFEELLLHARNNALRLKAGLKAEKILVSAEAPFLGELPRMYRLLIEIIPKSRLLSLLETADQDYQAILPSRKGVMNSAAFCEELVGWLLANYAERFKLCENSPVKKLVLEKRGAVARIGWRRAVRADRVVLCTNGFEKFKLVNKAGPALDAKFHKAVRGIVGYMAGYLEEGRKRPAEISYLPKNGLHTRDIYTEDPYFYLTRRPFGKAGDRKTHPHNLICVGGPEALMDDTNKYQPEHPYPDEAKRQISAFLKSTYRHAKKNISYKFMWHGLMGFTPNGLRLIGPEPANPVLYYNLGCNGVGLLPSIYGGKKISRFLSGEKLEPSLFDPK